MMSFGLGLLHSRSVSACGWALAVSVVCACNALDEAPPEDGVKLVVPTDDRAVVQALRAPPPISGGTLAVDSTQRVAVVADPDRDRISVVSLASGGVAEVMLEAGDEPGRVVFDNNGRAHVALRGTGELITVDVDAGEAIGRRSVCRAARGMAFDAELDALHVACVEGRIVTLPADPGAGEGPLRSLTVPEDVRDVVLQPDGSMLVSRFKRAELLRVDPDGVVMSTTRPDMLARRIDEFHPDGRTTSMARTFEPHVAYRMQALPTVSPDIPKSVVMLHQGSMVDEVDLDVEPEAPQQSSYGGGGAAGVFPCAGIVNTELSVLDGAGGLRTYAINAGVMPVDLAVSPTGQSFAIVHAGAPDSKAPRPFVVQENDDHGFSGATPVASHQMPSVHLGEGDGVVSLVHRRDLPLEREDGPVGCEHAQTLQVGGQPTAAVFTSEDQLLIQSRQPAFLAVLDLNTFENRTFALGGDEMGDTGHDLFTRDTGGGIACGSCHAEGGDDGHVWTFSGIGARRTQAVHVGLADTAPFHWDGDMRDLGMLMGEVFVGRMGGVHQSPERMESMREWLFGLEPPPAMVDANDEAAKRGEALFASAEVGCATCHAGATMTDNKSYHVGTTEGDHPLQVPSLRGIAYRAPFLHDGCADTLRDRFDPACGGGDEHGKTSHLSEGEIDDLVMYLKTR